LSIPHRIPEPISLGDPAVTDILEWDVKSWFPALRYWDDTVEWNQVEHVLDLGARRGGLSLYAALKGVSVVCSDRTGTEASARPLHDKYGLAESITYADIDATDIPYEGAFDLVMFKSVIGGVGYGDRKDRQHEVFRQIYKALKPGGMLIFAENLTASRVHRFLRKQFTRWGADWRYVTVPELREFTSEFSRTEIRTTGVSATFGRTEKQRSVLATIDRVILNAAVPFGARYIAYGCAVKGK